MTNKRIKRILFGLSLASIMPFSAMAQEQTTIELTLPKALEIALAENPTIRVADKEIELKQIADKEAWQNLLPSVDGQLALQHSIQVAAIKTQMGEFKMGMDGSTTAIASLTATLPIFAPAVYQNMKITKEDIKLAQEKARSSRLDLVNQVTKSYFAALLAQDSRDLMNKSYNVAKDNYDLVNKRYEVGSVSEYDKISAEVQMRSMKSSVTSAETGVSLSLLQLKVLMGIDPKLNIVINDSLKAYEDQMTLANTEVNTSELSNNSALRQIDHNLNLLTGARKILKTNFMPTVGLQLTGQYQSYSNDNWNVFNYKYSPSSTLSLAVTIPVFKASNFTKMKSNAVQMGQLMDTRDNTYRQLSMAAESYRQNMLKSIASLESDREAVKQAEKAVSISAKRYEVGRGTILELNQSETAETQAELTYHQSMYTYLTNKADLDYTLGRE